MEKKDWKQRLGSYDSWAMNESMFITIDGETIYTLDKLLDFIQQELDKAREDVLIELQKEFSEFGVPDDVRYTQPLFYINEVIEKKLSKLKSKEDGK